MRHDPIPLVAAFCPLPGALAKESATGLVLQSDRHAPERSGGPGDRSPRSRGARLRSVLFPAVVVALSWLSALVPARDRDERD